MSTPRPNARSRYRLTRLTVAFGVIAATAGLQLAIPASVVSAAPLCASPPIAGTTTLSGVVNTYFESLTPVVPAGQAATTVTVGTSTGAPNAIAVGDLVAIMQMQGAEINTSNTGAYGDGAVGNPASGFLNNANFTAGQYEFATVTSVAGSVVGLAGAGASGGLLNSYSNAAPSAVAGRYRYQLVLVPQYSSAVLDIVTPPTATPWNGTTGGVVMLDVAATLDLNLSSIDVSGQGFAGGLQRVRSGTGGFSNTDYRTPTSAPINGQKAEGIAGRPVWQTGDPDTVGDGYPNGDFGRGAPGNAGGGGTDGTPADNGENSGGGGGGNGGTGGRGGNTWNSNLPRGGFGGSPVPGSAARPFLGGGGGAGSDNNAVLSSAGGDGAGIVVVRAGSLTGTGTISANGADGDISGQDGSGGGGAGGTVVVLTSETGAASGIGGLTVNATGGQGGNETHPSAHGPGGGGGGGSVFTSAAPAGIDVSGGANGVHAVGPYGAQPGTAGVSSTAVPITDAPGTNTGSQCIDVVVDKTISPTDVVPGQTVTYTVVVTNQGPYPTSGTATVDVTDTLPVDLLTPTWTCTATAGSSCGAASGSGSIATTADLSVGGVATYVITGTLSPTFSGTLSNTATVAGPAGIPEVDPTNNSDTVDATEAPRVALTKLSDATGPLFDGDLVTYTVEIDNTTGSDIADVEVQDTLPPGMVYEPESTTVTFDQTTLTDTVLFIDDFESGISPWNEDEDGALGDDVDVATDPVVGRQALHIQDDDSGAWRAVGDLTGFQEAELQFLFLRSGVENGESIGVYFRDDVTGLAANDGNCSGAAWTELTPAIAPPPNTDPAYVSRTDTIPAALLSSSTNAGICFYTPNGGQEDADDFYFDDVSFVGRSATTTTVTLNNDSGSPSTPPLADGTAVPGFLVAPADAITLLDGTTMTITYQARLDTSLLTSGATTVTNGVTFDAPAYPGPETASVTDDVSVSDLSVIKTDSGSTVGGGQITYTITVANAGPNPAPNTIVTDTLDPNVTLDSVSSSQGGCTAFPCNLGTIASGSSATVTAVVSVGGGAPTGGTVEVDPNEPGTGDCAGADICNVASASSDSVDWDTTNNSDDEPTDVVIPTLAVDKPTPVLSVDADSSGDISAGDTLTYTITATNAGVVPLTNVVVSDPLITVTGGTTPCALVAPTGTCTLVGTYVVTAADVTAGSIVNTATADSDQTGPVTDGETTPVPNPSLIVDKPAPTNDDADGSGDVSVGDTLTYTITATNNGTANLTNVVVSDPLITVTGGTSPCALVGPLATCTLVGTYVVTAADVTAGSVDNTATADSDQTLPVTDDETTPTPNPSLIVDKPAPTNDDADGSGDVSVGDTLTYTITATNNGTANLTNVVVSDPLITPTGGTAPCALVAPAGTCTLVGTYLVTAADVTAGSIANTASSDSDQTAPVTDGETTTVPTPALAVDKPAPTNADDDGSGDVSVGDTLTYTITATNTGTANLTNVVVTDSLIAVTGGTSPCALVAPTGTCTLVGTYVVTAADVVAGQIDNTGTADSDQTAPVTDDETVVVPPPGLSVDKPAPANADEDGSGDVSVGDTLTYTITATNNGATTLTNVVVTDDLITTTGGTAPCAVVLPGGTCTLVGTYVVTAADVTAGSIVNTATADSDQTGPVTDGETTTVPTPVLAVDKPAPANADEDGSGDVSAGDTLTYTITATNTGTAILTNVVVTDPLITVTGGTSPCGLVTPAGTCTLVGTYVVTAGDVATGSIANTATADSDQTGPVTDDETVVVPAPDLSIDKPAPANADEDGSGDVSAGDTLTYTITATNSGAANLTNVVLTDPLITVTGGTSPCALVAPVGTCTLVGTYVVTPADVTAGSIANTATADSDQTAPVTDGETTVVPAPALAVDKPAPANADEDGSGDVSAGDTLTYTITATNSGTANLTNVVVTDPLITVTGGTAPCALVAPTGTCTLIGTFVVTGADVAAGSIANTGTADSDQTAAVTDDETVLVPAPALTVDKPAPVLATDADSSGDISAGDTLTYTVTATNTGTANLTDVLVSDPLITPTGGTTPCALVAPGDTCTLIGTYLVTTGDVTAGQIVNTGTADSDQTGPVTDDETVLVPNPELSVDKPAPTNADEDGSGDISIGDTLTYTITATNTGTANLTDVVVSDSLITPTGGTTPCALVAPTGTCTLVGTYVVTGADVTSGSIVNTGSADSDQTAPVTDDEVTPVLTPVLAVDKPAPTNADEDGSGDVSEGDTLTYTITATNTGGANLTNVVVTDSLITATGGTTPCALVAPAGTCTLVGTYLVTAADVAAGQIDNTGTADSDQTGPVTDDETVLVPTPELSVDKPAPTNADEDGSGDVSVGDTLTYTITTTNTGTANLTNVVVSDPLITATGGTTPCALVAPASTCTLIGTYVVTAADLAAGQIDNTGTADSDQTGPVTDDETVPLPTPTLTVDKPAPTNADEDGSGDVSAGDTLTYTITATNIGTATLTGVVVTDPLVTVTGGTSPCGSVLPSGTCTLVGTYVVTAADVAAGQIDNTGTADSDQTGPVTDDETVLVPTPELSVDKPAPTNADEDGSGDVSVGDTLTYTITATNTGAANLTDVVVTDDLITPNGGTTPCALLLNGDTCTLTGTYVVTAADLVDGTVVNTATADSDQTGPVTDDNVVTAPTPTLAVAKPAPTNTDEDGSGDVSVGDTLTYTITATNTGAANLTNVVVTDPMLTATGGTTPCALLTTGDACTLVGTYVVTAADVAAGQVDNTATADSDQTVPVTVDQTTPVPSPSLTVDKPAPANADEDGSGDVSVGDTLTYTITATNDGDANLTNVVVTDTLITPTGGTTPCALLAPTGTCTLIGTYVVTLADQVTGSIVNTATADSDQFGPVTDDQTTPVTDAQLTVDKPAPVNADEDGSGDVSAGDTLTYTITGTNTGAGNLTNVVLTDDLITPTGGTTPCALVIGGDDCTLIGTYVVTAADVTAGSIVNTATGDSDQTQPTTDDETTPVPTPTLAIDKAAPVNTDDADGSGDISAGDTLTYTITATNTGTANLTDVIVTDDLISPTGGTAPCALVAPGDMCTLIGTYLVTTGDVTAGSIVNTATADSDQTAPVSDTETTPLPAPLLVLDKATPTNADEDGSGDVSAGDTLTYTITATNTGASTLTDVVITDGLITVTGGTSPCPTVLPGGTCTLIGTYVVTPADVSSGQIVNTATADSDQTDVVTDQEITPVPQPGLQIVKSAPTNADEDGSGDVSVGDTLTYSITATNIGGAGLTNVTVTDPLLTVTGGTAPCALVTPSGTCTLVGTYVVTTADAGAGGITNTATADSDQTGPVTDEVTTPVPLAALVVVKPAPTLTTDADGSGDISAGDTLTYDVTATNVGGANLTDVVVTDDLITPTGGTTPCALVAAGGSCTLTGTYVVTAGDVAAGSIVNTATADSVQTAPVTDDETTTVPSPALVVVKPAPANADEDGSGDVSAGDTLTYSITMTNTGDANLTNVVVTDTLITTTGGTAPCALVAPAGTCTLVGTYVVTAGDIAAGSILNTATADSDQAGPVTDDRTTPAPDPALGIDKPAPVNADEDGSGDVSVGDTLTYTITATNNGAANLTNVAVTDDLITPTGGTTPCPALATGENCTLTGTYVVTAADVTAGQIDNTATAVSDQTPPVTDDVTVTVQTPELGIVKAVPANADEDGSGDVSVGDTLTYTITATNNGGANLTNVVVTDDLITPTGGSTPCALLLPTETCTLVGDHVVTPADLATGTISNTATADSDQTPPVDDTVVVPAPIPAIQLVKPAPTNADEDASGDISAGDTLTYTITATNIGGANLTNVVIADDIVSQTGGSSPCALVAPGGTCTLVGTYVVTGGDVTAGQIVNNAAVTSDQSPDDTATRTTPLPNPALAVDKATPVNADEDGSGDVSVGDTLTYTITATNNGTANLTDVVVSDPLITPTGGSTPCALLSPAQTCTLVGTYVVTAADVVNGVVNNTATADSPQTGPVQDSETTPAPRPAMSISKPTPVNADEDGSLDVSVGDTLTYTITVTNVGASNLTNVVVADDLVTRIGGTAPCAFLAPSATCTLVGTYAITGADVTAGEIVNVATADSDQTTPIEAERIVTISEPDLVIDKPTPTNADEDGSGDVSVGDTLTYTITATNTGTANLTGVTISDPMITTTGGTAPCATLAPGASCTLIGTYVVTAADVTSGDVENTATADSDQTPAVSDGVTVTVPRPALTVSKPTPVNADEDGSDSITFGDTLTYTITVTNTGDANLTNVTISDPAISVTGGTAPCPMLAPGGTCTLIGTRVVTAADVTAGEIENTATADSDQTVPSSDTVTVTTVGLGRIVGSIWVDRDKDGVRDPGEPALSGVTVVLEISGPDGIFGTADDERRTTVSSDTYSFDNVPVGQPVRVAVDPSTLPSFVRGPTFDLDGLLDNATVITLTAANPTATAVDFGYAPAALVPATGAESQSTLQVALTLVVAGVFLTGIATRRRRRW